MTDIIKESLDTLTKLQNSPSTPEKANLEAYSLEVPQEDLDEKSSNIPTRNQIQDYYDNLPPKMFQAEKRRKTEKAFGITGLKIAAGNTIVYPTKEDMEADFLNVLETAIRNEAQYDPNKLSPDRQATMDKMRDSDKKSRPGLYTPKNDTDMKPWLASKKASLAKLAGSPASGNEALNFGISEVEKQTKIKQSKFNVKEWEMAFSKASAHLSRSR